MTDDEKIGYREQYSLRVHTDMPSGFSPERSEFLRRAFSDFAEVLASRHPESEHHLYTAATAGPAAICLEPICSVTTRARFLPHGLAYWGAH